MKRLVLSTLCTIAMSLPAFAGAAVVVRYDFTGQPGDQVSTPPADSHPCVTAGDFTRGEGLSPRADTNSMSSSGWSRNWKLDLSENDYYAFTVTPLAGSVMTLEKLRYGDQVSLRGPYEYAIRSSLDGYASDVVSGDFLTTGTAMHTVYLGNMGSTFADIAFPITFRFYAWDADSSTGTWRIQNHSLAVPYGLVLEGQVFLPGDATGDGFIGDDDLSVLLSNWKTGEPVSRGQGDFTGDGVVGDDDLNILLGNWTGLPPVGTVLPEPATLSLLALGGVVMSRRRRR